MAKKKIKKSNRRKKIKSFSPLISGAWASVSGDRLRLSLFIVFFIVAYVFDLLVPWAVGYTLRVFVENKSTHDVFIQGLIGIGFVALFRLGNTLFHHLARWIQVQVAYGARFNVMSKVFETLNDFP